MKLVSAELERPEQLPFIRSQSVARQWEDEEGEIATVLTPVFVQGAPEYSKRQRGHFPTVEL